jgi:hypothetical protein
MAEKKLERGSGQHRFLVGLFSVVLTVLFIWALGFVVQDIGDLRGPDWEAVQERHIPAELTQELEGVEQELAGVTNAIEEQREIQGLLRENTNNAQQTMSQLMQRERLLLQKNGSLTGEEREALAESQAQFLASQRAFREANLRVAELSEQKRTLERRAEALRRDIDTRREPARAEFDTLQRRHEIRTAAMKLGVLLPLLLVFTGLVLKKRGTPFAPIFYAAFAAALWQTGVVMHEHFPRELFKYLAVGAAIVAVLALLVHLIRLITRPRPDWLHKQYKAGYESGRCPVCAYPIEREPALAAAAAGAKGPPLRPTAPYTCPSCGTGLFAACNACGAVRHALLPHCEHCGAAREG